MSEAINLVIYAMKNAKNGDIFVKKHIQQQLKFSEHSNKVYEEKKWKINVIGNRHGEKKT